MNQRKIQDNFIQGHFWNSPTFKTGVYWDIETHIPPKMTTLIDLLLAGQVNLHQMIISC